MWAVRIPPIGPPTLVQCGDSLEDLQALVGGNIETIRGEHPRFGAWVALCDEDGHAKHLEPNTRATAIAHMAGWNGPTDLLGPVVYLTAKAATLADVPPLMTLLIDALYGPVAHEDGEPPAQGPP